MDKSPKRNRRAELRARLAACESKVARPVTDQALQSHLAAVACKACGEIAPDDSRHDQMDACKAARNLRKAARLTVSTVFNRPDPRPVAEVPISAEIDPPPNAFDPIIESQGLARAISGNQMRASQSEARVKAWQRDSARQAAEDDKAADEARARQLAQDGQALPFENARAIGTADQWAKFGMITAPIRILSQAYQDMISDRLDKAARRESFRFVNRKARK